ncbi:SCL-interrupting locus protein homolog isoform X2 [Nothobranchius furzeri]|uniref:TAL1 (SCL) interrupting locus n=1 Tax=Nothobranchius furzeri TaxID=105023 RepID=A0A1A7ZKJ3_NOTFU|nr:SCL-interrupting locus protein homolog isoform X2 [Nothobranchius furzeri]KAF7202898.1 transcript variant X2 [Nothobranchius furzeri]
MSYPVNLQALPREVLEEVFSPGNMRGRNSVNSFTQLSFPKSRSALWDGSPAGDKLRLQLCCHRKPRVVLLEKALRLALRHARHSNRPRLQCFFLGSVSVDPDEEGITVNLDRFDPGRDQGGAAGRVPSALLPRDVPVPCLFSVQSEAACDVQSEAELRQSFKALQQAVSSRLSLDLSQLLRIRARVACSQTSDAAALTLSWVAVCPAVSVDVQPVRAIPIIPTALLRSLTSIGHSPQTGSHQRGFLTMDHTRKLVLLLESDPKACSLPLVGLWLSGVTHVYNPQVWARCVRFMFSSALQDRVLSESGCFLLVVFGSTHRTPQFFQCRGAGPEPQLDFQLLTASQSASLYQAAPVPGRVLQCELGLEDLSRQAEVFRASQKSFSSSPPPAVRLSDHDSGVEDEDFSPRPSPRPHPPAPQARRVQPSVPELSLLVDSFSSNHDQAQPSGSAPRLSPANRKSFRSSSAPKPAPPHLHSTPNSNLQEPCTCCPAHTYNCTPIFPSPALPPAAPPASHHQAPPPSSPAPPHQNALPPSANHLSTPPVSSASSQQQAPPFSSHHSVPPSSHQHSTPSFPLPAPLHPIALPPSTSHPSTPPASPVSCHQQTAPPLSHPSAPPPSHKQTPPSSCHYSAPPPRSYHHTTRPSSPLLAPLLPSHSYTPPPSSNAPSTPPLPPASTCLVPSSFSHSPPSDLPSSPSTALPPHHHTPPPPFTLIHPPAPSCPCSHAPPLPLSWCCDSSSSHPSRLAAADSVTSPWLLHPLPVNRCCDKMGGVAPSDTYQLLLHQDRQLRLLQAQIQMLLEAQGKVPADTQTSTSTASIAVETGASLFWGGNPEHRDELPGPGPSSKLPPSSSSSLSSSSHDLSVRGPAGGPEEEEVRSTEVSCSASDHHSISRPQSPVLGESVSMYGPPEEQQSFYQNLMIRLNSRLQEAHHNQEAEDESRRSSVSASQSSQSKPLQQKKSANADPVVRATLRQLQQLGVDVDQKDLMESNRTRAVENASTLASINPAAVVSRLVVSDLTSGALLPGGSVDLSLEANAIALRYLTDSQLNKLSLGGHAPQHVTSSTDSLLSPSNMSLATRKYMRRYGLIEEEEEQEEEVRGQEARQPLSDALNVRLLPQSQLIRDLRPKMQLLTGGTKPDSGDKENRSGRRNSLVRAGGRELEGSLGNILDLSRLRQLPKLF